jgi:hypothetical protein
MKTTTVGIDCGMRRKKGVTPVAILGSADFDAGNVDPATLAFGPDGALAVKGVGLEDVNEDGFLDLVTRYVTEALRPMRSSLVTATRSTSRRRTARSSASRARRWARVPLAS